MNQKGQISLIGIVSIGAAIAIASVGGWLSQTYRTDVKIENLRIEQQTKIDKQSAEISNININVALICQRLNVKCRE